MCVCRGACHAPRVGGVATPYKLHTCRHELLESSPGAVRVGVRDWSELKRTRETRSGAYGASEPLVRSRRLVAFHILIHILIHSKRYTRVIFRCVSVCLEPREALTDARGRNAGLSLCSRGWGAVVRVPAPMRVASSKPATALSEREPL